jgi:hypothetical protein
MDTISLPVMVVGAFATIPSGWGSITIPQWLGLAYVSVFSMLIGFVFWYRGLPLGGIAGVGQLQLLQPFFGLMLAALLLHEPVAWTMIVATAPVVMCVAVRVGAAKLQVRHQHWHILRGSGATRNSRPRTVREWLQAATDAFSAYSAVCSLRRTRKTLLF